MGISIITDSACDITQEASKELGIKIIPLRTIFGDEEYIDGVTISHKEFFEKLIETDVFPHTSQVSPGEYEEAFSEAIDKGDDVVCITLASKLSGCFQSAMIAKNDMERDNIYLVDSNNACIGEQILVKYACRLRDEGKSAKEIARELEIAKDKVRLVALVDTLEYLKKGGRLSGAAATIGTILSIKPVIAVEDGEVVVLGKARGSKNGNNMLTEMIGKYGGVDFKMPFVTAYSGLSDDMLKKYIADNSSRFEKYIAPEDVPITTIGSTIGTHAGPGAIAVAFFSE